MSPCPFPATIIITPRAPPIGAQYDLMISVWYDPLKIIFLSLFCEEVDFFFIEKILGVYLFMGDTVTSRSKVGNCGRG